jgi:HD-like signal output (HDOD) protein/ActR/RegA family two-component response regulator
VLFVDDEPAILTGLGRMLRPLRHEIQSDFVNGGAEALSRLAKDPFDIVVADIRMPGMDGAALLDAVQRAHPHIIRIVLSGHADVSAALRSVPVAHQFLAKPCDAIALRDVITRAVGLHGLLQDRELQSLVAGMRDIPARPRTYSDLTRLLGEPSTTSSDIAKLISRDVALSATLLKIVNSAFFGLPRRVTSIESAINYLGTSTLRSVLLATAATSSLGPRASKLGYDLEANETHALLSANLAAQFFNDKNVREDAFAAALLQNVGVLLLLAEAGDDALQAIRHSEAQRLPLQEAERELRKVSHSYVGAYLLGSWGLPYSIVEAVAHHHDPGAVPHDKLDLVDAVYAATLVADQFLLNRPESLELARQHIAKLGAPERLARVVSSAEHWLNQPSKASP